MATFVTKEQIVEWLKSQIGERHHVFEISDRRIKREWEMNNEGIDLERDTSFDLLKYLSICFDTDPMQLSEYIAGWHRHRKRQQGDADIEDLKELGYGG